MLVAAALVPETALLIPGAAGALRTLEAERGAALAAVGDLLTADPGVVVVVTAGPVGSATLERSGALRPTLNAAGVDDAVLGWRPAVTRADAGGVTAVTDVTEVAAAVGLLLLAEAGWTGATRTLRVAPPEGADLREHGRRLAARSERVALLLVASLSARRGPDAPLADDARAESFDEAALADLVDLGPAAAARLAQVPSTLATELAVSAWAPWQVLAGAAEADRGGAPLRGDLRRVGAPFGATYAVVVWRPV